MEKRFVSIWFRYLKTDWFSLQNPELKKIPLALRIPDHGRMIVSAANAVAQAQGITTGITVADARAITPKIQVLDDKPEIWNRLLTRIAAWCIRFSPVVAIDPPDGLLLDVSGCTHLWGGDKPYLTELYKRFKSRGYDIRLAIADTPAAAWAVARFGKDSLIIAKGQSLDALLALPPEALRLEAATVERLYKLGLRTVQQFIHMPAQTLRRRFGSACILRINQALGVEEEMLQPVVPIPDYQERLPCLELIATATGIAIALEKLLATMCARLQREQKGLKKLCFKGYRVDGKMEQVDIATNSPSHHAKHLFKLFEIKLPNIEPDLGIELFVLEASGIAEHVAKQEYLWGGAGGLHDIRIAEMIDRMAGRVGIQNITRYLPAEHYWPERSMQQAKMLEEQITTAWPTTKPRPVQLLSQPEPITVTAPVPDYPPMSFRYKGILHTIAKADGPERIEQEWWLQQGQHRDYYAVEDKEGRRYWIFRLGHYDDKTYQWFIHGFFA
ncbi:MAG: DNA polymerase Y family protein [Agriterribacter sp.]